MSSCCSTDLESAQACPECGTTGPVVGVAPVRPHRMSAADGDWQHCSTESCPVVFHLDADTLTSDDVITQVAHKALDKPQPVCFCFSHTAGELADDLAANDGVSSIKADVKEAVADGLCKCEFLNPSTKCCLADIHRTLKTITAELKVPS